MKRKAAKPRPKRKARAKAKPTAPQTPPSLTPQPTRDWFDQVLEDRAKNAGGRPPAELDLVLVEKLAALMCTDAEIASICNVSRATVMRRKKLLAFRQILDRGRNAGCASLRRRQMAAAESGNVTAQIWLGKQYLGQKDKVQHDGRYPGATEGTAEAALGRLFARVDRAAAAGVSEASLPGV
jgi:hypothetical protein